MELRKAMRLMLGAFLLLLVISTPYQQQTAAESIPAQARTDLTGIKVAVYEGTSLASVIASKDALVHMYEWMNATVDVLNVTQIINEGLNEYRILAMPGGNPITFTNRFGSAGRAVIREWVSRGGSYFGICGGAMFAVRVTDYGDPSYYQLNLWNGTVQGPLGSVNGMTEIAVNTTCSGPDLGGVPASLSSNYQGGGYYVPDEGQSAYTYTLATYDYNSQPALIASTYGTGTVCLSATHVEIEEDGDRDGTTYYDDTCDDSDSEWDLMLQISLWQIESSTWVEPTPTSSTTTTTTATNETIPDVTLDMVPVAIVASIAIVVVVLTVVIFKKR
ncbi:MAG: BPL-N domain-containing protein [Candidatus Thorarchaeota archaeon]